MVIFYLPGYLYFFGRLDSGGETSPKATFLATTLGLRRLFLFLEAISNPTLLSAFLKRIVLELEKILLNSASYTKGENLVFSKSNFDVQIVCFFAKNPSRAADFYAAEGFKGVMNIK